MHELLLAIVIPWGNSHNWPVISNPDKRPGGEAAHNTYGVWEKINIELSDDDEMKVIWTDFIWKKDQIC